MLHAYVTPNVMHDFSWGSHSSVFQLSRLNHSLQNAANEGGSLYYYCIYNYLSLGCSLLGPKQHLIHLIY